MTLAHVLSNCRPQTYAVRTSFALDCSNQSTNSLDPDCMRLRDLFAGKEVLGSSVTEDCGVPYETENPFKRVKRVIYVHDSQDGLWYHCCEYRPPFGYFSHRTPPPKLEAEDVSLGSMAMKFASGLFAKKKSQTEPDRLPVGQAPKEEGDFMEQPQGPLLQCNVYENLKLVQNKDIGTRESLGDMPTRCMGDEAVLLRRFTGGSKRKEPGNPLDPTEIPKDTECVDIGPKGTPTVLGKESLLQLHCSFEVRLTDPAKASLCKCDSWVVSIFEVFNRTFDGNASESRAYVRISYPDNQ